MPRPRVAALFAVTLLPAACGDDGGEGASSGATTTVTAGTGTSTTDTAADPTLDPTTGTAGSDTASGTATDTTGAGCPPRSPGCPCEAGACDGDLVCEAGVCESGGIPEGMVLIEGGSFDDMGDGPNEEHGIDAFLLDLTEVTRGAYAACVDAQVCEPPSEFVNCTWIADAADALPINCVDAIQAETYCGWLGKRLPTEWEWEWAARGRDEARMYPWGDAAPTCDYAVMFDPELGSSGCGLMRPWDVGSKPAGDSRDGVHDLAGNMWEWTSSRDTLGPQPSALVLRGGAWGNLGDVFVVSWRFPSSGGNRNDAIGFRCARDAG